MTQGPVSDGAPHPHPDPNPATESPAMLVDGTWYRVAGAKSCCALAQDVKKHLHESEPWIYDLAPAPHDSRAGARETETEAKHVVLDGGGRMVPLGVMTHGEIPPPT